MSDDSPSPRQPRKRIVRIALLLIFALASVTGVSIYFAYQRQPGHWTTQQQRIKSLSREERQQISQSLFNRATTQWSKAPDHAVKVEDLIGHRTALEVSYEELNIWLAEDGVALLSDIGIEMPRSIRGAMVDSPGDGLLRISCDIKTPRLEQVVTLTFKIEIDDAGKVVSELISASAGLLPLPTDRAISLITKRDRGDGLLQALMSGSPTGPIDVPIDASKDGLRDGRLVGFEVYDDRVVITRETVLRSRTD